MNHNALPTPEVSQDQLSELVNLVEQATNSVYASSSGYNHHKIWISASTGAFEDTGRFGNLVIERNPQVDPQAFLSVRHLENGLGEERNETEVLYTFSKDIDGRMALQVSDVVSGDTATQLLLDAAEFDDTVKDHPDKEMVTAAQDTYEQEIHEAFTLEAHELMMSLKPATERDCATLKSLLETALSGNVHKSASELEYEKLESGDVISKRRKRIAASLRDAAGRLLGMW